MSTKKYGANDPTLRGSPDLTSADQPLPTDTGYVGSVFKERYFVSKELGRGNIGVVYQAEDRQLHSKPVVIKVLIDACSQNQWFRKKFSQEIEALSRVDHPGVVNVTDSGITPDGKSFLVMQLIKGASLRSLISYNGMDLELTATILRQLGQALTAAHAEGVIHCDLKPENIMLQDLGEGDYQVKIVDFGVAKVQNSQVASATPGTSIAGTLYYMAPEQYEGRPGQASDIFALGVIAYEMLTGRRPFNPATPYRILETIQEGVKIRPRDLRPAIPEQAQELILQALSYEPAGRPERARDFGELLAQALTRDGEPVKPGPSGEPELELAHVLFMDLVGYSALPTNQQTALVKRLQRIVNNTESFKRAKSVNELISRSTGDGMALVFFSGPKAAAECALEIAGALKSDSDIKLRMGINSGPVYRVKDMNQEEDVAGAGVNIAQRVMDCGDAGHILVSNTTVDVLGEMCEWRERLHDLGVHKVKHGVPVHLFNLYAGGLGNGALPRKLRKTGIYRMSAAAAAILVVAAALAVKVIWFSGAGPAPPGPGPITVTGPERSLSYSLTVKKYRNGNPFKLADANQIFESKYYVKLNVVTPQPGYFYVLNEAPGAPGENPRYNVLYPSSADKGNAAATHITTPEPADQWFQFDNKKGTEKLWLVWSPSPIPEMEAVKRLANQQNSQIMDAAQSNAVHEMLARFGASKLKKETDEDAKQTSVKGTGNVLVYPLNLEHQ